MRLLDLAQQNGAANDYTDAIRGKVLSLLDAAMRRHAYVENP